MARRLLRFILVAIFIQQFAATSFAQVPDSQTQADIHRLLEINGSFTGPELIADQVIALVMSNIKAQQPDFPDRFFVIVQETLKKEITRMINEPDGFRTGMVAMYAKHYTPAEIASMLEFFDSPVGRKVTSLQATIMQEGSELGRQWAEKNAPRIRTEVVKALMAAGRPQ